MSARVLVVDDVEANVKLLEAKLSSEYFDVLSAFNGHSALEIADSEVPDVILLDVMMPRMDGFEVCRRLKANPRTADVPVVMVTALSDVANRLRGLEAGTDHPDRGRSVRRRQNGRDLTSERAAGDLSKLCGSTKTPGWRHRAGHRQLIDAERGSVAPGYAVPGK